MSIFLTFLVAMSLYIGTGTASNSSVEGKQRIVGGEDAMEGEIPYQIMLQYRGFEICGGSLVQIGRIQAVITAGHCLHSGEPGFYSVIAGEHNTAVSSGNEQKKYVSKLTIHPEYNRGRHLNDIAILIPQDGFVLNKYVAPIRLPTEDDKVPEQGVISGWGSKSPWRDSSNVLQKAIVKIVDNETCKKNYEDTDDAIIDSMVCAADEGIDSCQGDSGGLLAAVFGINDIYIYNSHFTSVKSNRGGLMLQGLRSRTQQQQQ